MLIFCGPEYSALRVCSYVQCGGLFNVAACVVASVPVIGVRDVMSSESSVYAWRPPLPPSYLVCCSRHSAGAAAAPLPLRPCGPQSGVKLKVATKPRSRSSAPAARRPRAASPARRGADRPGRGEQQGVPRRVVSKEQPARPPYMRTGTAQPAEARSPSCHARGRRMTRALKLMQPNGKVAPARHRLC